MTDFWSKDINMNQHQLKTLNRMIAVFSFINMILLCLCILLTLYLANQGFNNHHRDFASLWDFKIADKRNMKKTYGPDPNQRLRDDIL